MTEHTNQIALHHRQSARIVARLLLCLVGVTSCEKRTTTSDGPYADLVAKFTPKLEKQTGMKFKTPPKLASKSKEEVARFVMQQLTSERTQTQITGQQGAYRLLGLIPDTMNLGALLQRLLEEQIIGYYDPTTKVLYVVDGSPALMLNQTVAHELMHALQDQYVNIDSIQKSDESADRQGAAQAILEGQAVFEQLRLDPNVGPMLVLPGGWDRIRDVIRDGQGSMPVFASAPRAIREGLLFPYLGGADFVRRFIEKRPEKELLNDLPISTTQILNDAAYFTTTSAQREVPVRVALAPPASGTVTYSNTFGEFETRLILVQHLKDEAVARRGAQGIAGDQYAVIRTSFGDALTWATVWKSTVDAGDFLDLITDAIRRRYEMGRLSFAPGATMRQLDVTATSSRGARSVTVRLEQIGGRPVVYVVDAPTKAAAALVNTARITLSN